MTVKNGRFDGDTEEEILDAMLADAKEYFGADLNDTSLNVIRTFYRPIASRLALAQQDIGLILDSAQLDHASGQALDLLTALIGITRDEADKATGTAKFSRDSPATSDYTIPKGTIAQTDALNPVEFTTTEGTIIAGESTETDTNTYSTSNTSATTKTSFTVDTTYRETVDVEADFRTTNSSYTAYLDIVDATNGTTIHSDSTTSTSFVTSGPTTYDVSGLSGDITVEYRIHIGNSSGTAELTNSDFTRGGEVAATASIEAVEGGPEGNVGANTIVVMPDPPTGVEDVTNSAATSGGTRRETDDELRKRAKEELAEGSRASAPALVNSVQRLYGVTSVSIFINDTKSDNTGSGGLPDHSFELVVAGGNKQDIGQTILDTKAAGDTSYGGANGSSVTVTSDLPNGQTHDITFSRPSTVKIYADVDLTKTDEYAGDDAVRDAIVEYIGGIRTSGNDVTGLGVGADVIYTEVMAQIQMVEGVYDVTNLELGTSADPTGTSNIRIADHEVATADGTDSSIAVSTQSA